MSDKLPVISGKELIRLLEKHDFVVARVKGSHHLMKHTDGTTVPVHKNEAIPKGLLRKIIREDIAISLEEFGEWIRC